MTDTPKKASTARERANEAHGMKRTKEYKCWENMKQRCLNKNHTAYLHYGGRGIKVCKDWLSSFNDFLSDMGKMPTSKHTLDRINTNLGYKKENCRWATRREQNLNRRITKRYEHDGKNKTLIEWSEVSGIKLTTLYMRIQKGLSIKDAIDFKKWKEGKT